MSTERKANLPASNELPPEGLITIKQVSLSTTKSRAQIYNDLKAGTFPPPVRLSARRVAWKVETIRAYIADPSAFNGL